MLPCDHGWDLVGVRTRVGLRAMSRLWAYFLELWARALNAALVALRRAAKKHYCLRDWLPRPLPTDGRRSEGCPKMDFLCDVQHEKPASVPFRPPGYHTEVNMRRVHEAAE